MRMNDNPFDNPFDNPSDDPFDDDGDEELWDLFVDEDIPGGIVFPKLNDQVMEEDIVPCFADQNGNPIPCKQYENFPITVDSMCHQYVRDRTQTPACWLWN